MRTLRLVWIVAIMSACNLYFFMGSSGFTLTGNERAHTLLLSSIVSDGSFELLENASDIPMLDMSRHSGKYYSNKPPGFPLLMAPPFFLLTKTLGVDVKENSEHNALSFLKAANALISILAVVLTFLLLSELGVSDGSVIFGTAAATFGSFFPAYSCLATSIPLSILLTVFSLYCYFKFLRAPHRPWLWALAVFAASYAVIVDYPNGFFLLPLFALLAWQIKNQLKLAVYAMVGLIPLGLILFYNHKAFGNPFTFSYTHYVPHSYVPWEGVAQSMALANMPRGFYGLMLSPSRGMLLLSPVTILGIIVTFGTLRRKQWDRFAISAMAMSGILIMSTYTLWHGGHCMGYRHAISGAVLLAALSSVFFDTAKRLQRWFAVCLLVFSCFTGILAYHIQLDRYLLRQTWKNEPADTHANFYTELLWPYLEHMTSPYPVLPVCP